MDKRDYKNNTNIFYGIYFTIYSWIYSKKEIRSNKKFIKKYPHWNYENWIDDMEHIWGVVSWDDIMGKGSNMYSLNDIDITFDHNTKKYSLSIETIYSFKNGYEGQCGYLKDLLMAFEKFMDSNNYDKTKIPSIHSEEKFVAKTIPELFCNFKSYVNGFCSFNIKECL